MSEPDKQADWRGLRRTLGVRQDYFAHKTGVYRTKLSNWEHGKIALTDEELRRVVEAIDEIIIERSEARNLKAWEKFASPKCVEAGAACQRLRRASGISQIMLAKKVGINQSSLSLFENGYMDLSDEVLERLNKTLVEMAKTTATKLGTDVGSVDRQPGVQLRNLLDQDFLAGRPTVFSSIPSSIQQNTVEREQNRNLRKQIEIMKEIIEIQDGLITKGIDGPALVAEAAKKDEEIAALKQRVKDLMEMYDIGSQAVAATARYEELRGRVQKPVVADDKEEPE
jgi:transcriptional regulator with XRE-family HTH domain